MMYLGDYSVNATVTFRWGTYAATGSSTTRLSDGVVAVYQDADSVEITAGITDIEDVDGLTGIHLCQIDLSNSAYSAASGSDFMVVLQGATIDGQSVNAVLAHFSVENRSGLRPTVAGRELNVAADGDIGGNVDGTNLGIAALIGSPVLDVSQDIAAVQADTDNIQTRLPAALFGGRMNCEVQSISGSQFAADRLQAAADTMIECIVDTVINGHTPTATEFQSDTITEATTGHYNGRTVHFQTGVLAGQATDITGYTLVGGIGQFTVTAMTEPPANNDTFIII